MNRSLRTGVLLLYLMHLLQSPVCQNYALGWEGIPVLPDGQFRDPALWQCNQSDLSAGDSCKVTADTAVHMHWYFGKGDRSKFCQVYQSVQTPIDLSWADMVGITVKGEKGSSFIRNMELKFESGSVQAAYTWDNLAHIDRWCERLVVLKDQFSHSKEIRWDSITIVSLAVTMGVHDGTDTLVDSGILSFCELIVQSVDSFSRAKDPEPLTSFSSVDLETIRVNAATAIKNRQNPNGLLTTWLQDGTSWLYGQGLALRVLTEEGKWNEQEPENEFARAAKDLAHFLATSQASDGYWPRAWSAASGDILRNLEDDHTVWMGDFPWIPGSLAYYYRKSGDQVVLPVILRAKSFLYTLIEPTGKVNTMNMISSQQSEVSNFEGHAATMYCLLELGDTSTAKHVMDYVMQTGWDPAYCFWKEGPESLRPVLLVNTWIASLAASMDYQEESIQALSLIGKLMYTRGPGEPYGFDGVGPVATWYEGTLSYIASLGPGSDQLFSGIVSYINPDGTVPAYNDDLGSIAGIWAVEWPSLDATSWLYFAAAQHTPFGYSGADQNLFTPVHTVEKTSGEIIMEYRNGKIGLNNHTLPACSDGQLCLYSLQGSLLGSTSVKLHTYTEVAITDLADGELIHGQLYLLILTSGNHRTIEKMVY